ncbi:MAG: hypothetical protein ACD_76C00102G0002 [uncultured bacterium]|nr:MAG: hypothetical protein ACD_76C00102G0002 [uncultured bacterium]HBD05622.1 DNA-protecting protein DprA [Candidatus Uhrbacteria bacterium]
MHAKIANMKTLYMHDSRYPPILREIHSPPNPIFVLGNTDALKGPCFAVVGARRPSQYGQRVVEAIVPHLVEEGFVIVSGLAYGIDSFAHEATLKAGGRTVAVLGSGIELIHPSGKQWLAKQIIENDGAIISEFPGRTAPLKHHFPMRNRIISGMSLGVFVAEACIKSGSLITARAALEQNREVFASPGSIFSPLSEGPLSIIKQGATPVAKISDILDQMNLKTKIAQSETRAAVPESHEETALLAALSHEPTHIDELIRATGMDASTVSGALTLLELKGRVIHAGGMQYLLN